MFALLFEGGRLDDGLGQCFGAAAREEKACFIVHDFGTCHVVGEDDARAAQDGFDADQSERLIQGRHDGEVGGAVEFGHVFAETQFDDVFHGTRQRRTGDGEFDGQVGVFEKVRQQIESFALVAGRGEQEHGFVVLKAVFRADGGGFIGGGIEAGGVGGRVDDVDFFGRHAVERGQFALHQVRMCHDGFGRRVVAAVAADGEAVEQACFLLHVMQVAQVCAAAGEYIRMVAGVAGNKQVGFAADFFEGAAEEERPQFFGHEGLIDKAGVD